MEPSHNQPPPAAAPDNQSIFARTVGGVRNIGFIRNIIGEEVKPPVAQPLDLDPSASILPQFYKLKGPDLEERGLVLPSAVKYASTLEPGSVKEKVNKKTIELLHSKQRLTPASSLAPILPGPPARPYPYTRNIRASDAVSPDLGSVFDQLLRAKDNDYKPHKNGISGMTYAFATILTLCLFRTNPSDSRYNETSSYFDLSPLYGVNDEEQSLVRNIDGRGMLSPDCFHENRTVLLPPAAAALLILWNRNHNYIAHHLLLINEHARWSDPSSRSSGSLSVALQDEEIFQKARLINCAVFKNVVVEDFMKGLLGLENVGNSAGLDLFRDSATHEGGHEHRSSVEFSLLYHWSGIASQVDERWTERTISDIMDIVNGQSLDTITPEAFQEAMDNISTETGSNRRRRNLAGLPRNEEGRFNDADIARILQTATESQAHAPRGHGIAPCMRVVEMMIMKQAREWKVCSLNDFRRFLGLKPFGSFEEWSSSYETVAAATKLYGKVDNMELYPGLQAEDPMPGSGFCLGYTMTFGLLVDIVTCARSDPQFSTITETTVTKWGYRQCLPQADNGAFGATLPTVLIRNLPDHYPYDNVYSLFPFTLPTTAKKPDSPNNGEKPHLHETKSLEAPGVISQVFNDPATYSTPYGKNLELLTDKYGYLLGFDDEDRHDADQRMTLYALIPDRGELRKHAESYARIAEHFIELKTQSADQASSDIDIVKDVINVTCTRWVCETICGSPKEYDEAQMYDIFVDLHNFIFRNHPREEGWAIRDKAVNASKKLVEQIKRQFEASLYAENETWLGLIHRIYKEMAEGVQVGKASPDGFLERLARSIENDRETETPEDVQLPPGGFTPEEEKRIVANVLGLCVMSSVSFAQVCSHAINFYLDPKREKELKEIVELSEKNSSEDNSKIMGYIREAQRLEQSLSLVRIAKEDATISQGVGLPKITVVKGDHIVANLKKAHMDAAHFPDPEKVVCTRPKIKSVQGIGLHKCPGVPFVDETMPEIFKAIFRLKNLRRTEDSLATCNFRPAQRDTDPKVYMSRDGTMSFVPRSMVLKYDRVKSKSKAPPNPEMKTAFAKMKYFLYRNFIALAMALVLILIFIMILYSSAFLWSNLSWPTRHSPPVTTPVTQAICNGPTKIIEPYHIRTIVPGLENQPLPYKYTTKERRSHLVTVIDMDKRDTKFTILVDDHLVGATSNFTLDKSVGCGEIVVNCGGKKGADCGKTAADCVGLGFSSGMVIVPPGRHTVTIRWAGDEFFNGTEASGISWGEKRRRGYLPWGDQRQRRFLMQRESCS